MRIQSNFKDYYDVGQSLGQDQTLVYKRYKKVVEVENKHYPFPSFWRDNAPLAVHDYVIGFCGKLYGMLELNTNASHFLDCKSYRNNRKFCFNAKDVDDYMVEQLGEEKVAEFHKGHSRYNFVRYFEQREAGRNLYTKYFEDNRCPIFVACKGGFLNEKGNIIYNACLKHYGFFRLFEPFQAYQELAMYLGNQAEPRKPIPPISDEVMLEIKGFDKKFSFRKPKR